MNRESIAETTLAGLRPAGIGGRRTLDAWDQLSAFIAYDDKLGPEHARVLAEPVIGNDGSVEWYKPSGLDGNAIAISDLPAVEQEALKTRARELTEAIRNRAEELRSESREDLRRMGETLSSALLLPREEEILFSIDGSPVLINWGTLNDVPEPPLAVLEDYLRATPPPVSELPVSEPPAAASVLHSTLAIHDRWSWWNLLWLLFTLLLAFLFFLLLFGCGLGLSAFRGGLLDYCPGRALARGALESERERGAALEAEIRRMEEATAQLPDCARLQTAQSPDPEASPPEDEDSVFERRRAQAGGETGEVTVTLIWDGAGYPDLDLKVICPAGDTINYRSPSSCSGNLDVDANGGADRRAEPVENIFWPEGAAQPGIYQVYVDNYDGRNLGDRSVPFNLEVQIGESKTHHEGRVAPPGQGDFVTSFSVESP